MKSKSLIIIGVVATVILAIGFMLFFAGISINNGLISKEEAVNKQWANVQNAYQRRADLIPNLVSTVKGYANHEEQTLIGVVEQRAKATQITIDPANLTPEKMKEYQAAQGELSSALGKLMVIRENYPDLKANTNFIQLQDELAGTENRINVERNKFNETVNVYNASIRKFPASIVAGFNGFQPKTYFEADQASQTAPTVGEF